MGLHLISPIVALIYLSFCNSYEKHVRWVLDLAIVNKSVYEFLVGSWFRHVTCFMGWFMLLDTTDMIQGFSSEIKQSIGGDKAVN